MHTIEQAKELWCPMVRAGSSGSNVDWSRADRSPNIAHCIGDKCAMWRWNSFEKRPEQAIVDDPSMGVGGKRMTTVNKLVGVAGYCGLAGRPEVVGHPEVA